MGGSLRLHLWQTYFLPIFFTIFSLACPNQCLTSHTLYYRPWRLVTTFSLMQCPLKDQWCMSDFGWINMLLVLLQSFSVMNKQIARHIFYFNVFEHPHSCFSIAEIYLKFRFSWVLLVWFQIISLSMVSCAGSVMAETMGFLCFWIWN